MTQLEKDMQHQLDDWKAKLERLKLQGELAGHDAKQKKRELLRSFEETERAARARLTKAKDDADKQLTAARGALEAGWDELLRTYRQLKDD